MDTKSSTTHIECIEFTGYKDRNGYGQVRRNGVLKYAHRASYEEAHGEIPSGLILRHTCDNPACINVAHLILGTQSDNMQDKVDRNRQSKGTDFSTAKLDEEKVRFIRSSKLKLRELREMFGVSEGILSEVRRGKRWAHVQ
ncbi:HNH endonuclease [Pseudomonas phage PCW2]|nr:HNH endonuclease [Pseudomonas phage PCW2]